MPSSLGSCPGGSSPTSSCGSSAYCSAGSQDEACCWICLGGPEDSPEPLQRPCACPARHAHASCLARWQVQQAGRDEERACRFCHAMLPDWRSAHAELPKSVPVFTVVYEGVTHSLPVHPGPEGQRQFLDAIRSIYGLSADAEVSLSFGCKVPGGGEVVLEGASCFDAAVHLASISAGERLAKQAQVGGEPGCCGAGAAACAAQGQGASSAAPPAAAPSRGRWRMFS